MSTKMKSTKRANVAVAAVSRRLRGMTKAQRLKLAVALMAQAAQLLGWGIMMKGKKSKFIRYIVMGEKKELERIDNLLIPKKMNYTTTTASSSNTTITKVIPNSASV